VGWTTRILVTNATGNPEDEKVFINPEILKKRGKVVEEEGCLSFPGIFANVPRSAWVRVRALDLDGKPFELEAEELQSRALQHEIDHLEGILYINRMSPAVRKGIAPQLRELERLATEGQTVRSD